jgi:hypothetical protein
MTGSACQSHFGWLFPLEDGCSMSDVSNSLSHVVDQFTQNGVVSPYFLPFLYLFIIIISATMSEPLNNAETGEDHHSDAVWYPDVLDNSEQPTTMIVVLPKQKGNRTHLHMAI